MQFLFAPVVRFLSPRSRIWVFLYRQLDDAYRLFEARRVQAKLPHLALIPPARMRLTGSTTLSRYAHDIGFISALIAEHVTAQGPQVLDLGCGPGKGTCAALQFLGETGHYHGLDINRRFIEFDRSWYPADRCSFIHVPVSNAYYQPDGTPMADYRVPLDDGSIDLVLALSLFTHLDRPDTERYFAELRRLMKPGAVGLVTFFVLDQDYDPARYAGTRWDFNVPLPGQPEWYGTSALKQSEVQIGVGRKGLDGLLGDDFELVRIVRGGWGGRPASYHQDVVVVRRK